MAKTEKPKPVSVSEMPAREFDAQGCYILPADARKEFWILLDGARWEHAGETADGRWTYQRS